MEQCRFGSRSCFDPTVNQRVPHSTGSVIQRSLPFRYATFWKILSLIDLKRKWWRWRARDPSFPTTLFSSQTDICSPTSGSCLDFCKVAYYHGVISFWRRIIFSKLPRQINRKECILGQYRQWLAFRHVERHAAKRILLGSIGESCTHIINSFIWFANWIVFFSFHLRIKKKILRTQTQTSVEVPQKYFHQRCLVHKLPRLVWWHLFA